MVPKELYITLDYELFLNDLTGDVDSCLIKPTEKFLELTNNYGVKATFFVDASYLYRLRELGRVYPILEKDYEKVTTQVRRISEQGHCIALHIHPQWFYSDFDGENWTMDFDHYKLSDMPQDLADTKFVQCLNLLEDLSHSKIKAYRAGGYSIQGYKSFPDILVKNGIIYDSSVLCGMKNLSKLHYFDYSIINRTTIYTFDNDVLHPNKEGKGAIKEFPITTAKLPFLQYCYLKIKNRGIKSNRNWGNGGDLPTKRSKGFLNSLLKKMGKPVWALASIDYQSFSFSDYVLKKNAARSSCIVMIGHPKNFSPASLSYLEDLIKRGFYSFKTIQ